MSFISLPLIVIMPRGRPRRATRAKIVDIPSSDEEMEVEEEDPIADVDEPEIAVEPEEEDEEDEESEDKEDELDEDDEQVRAPFHASARD